MESGERVKIPWGGEVVGHAVYRADKSVSGGKWYPDDDLLAVIPGLKPSTRVEFIISAVDSAFRGSLHHVRLTDLFMMNKIPVGPDRGTRNAMLAEMEHLLSGRLSNTDTLSDEWDEDEFQGCVRLDMAISLHRIADALESGGLG